MHADQGRPQIDKAEERVVSDLLLAVLARACGLDVSLDGLLRAEERIEEQRLE